MIDLKAKSAADGLLPLTIGSVTVTEVVDLPVATLATYRGQDAAAALKKAHGVVWPAVGTSNGDIPRAAWFGHAHVLLMGAVPDAALSKVCAVTDQTDAWTIVDVSGAGAKDVLARLTPMDLRDDAFPVDASARTEIQHMQGAVIRTATDTLRVMVFRSMAKTLVHDLKTAMAGVVSLRT